MFVIPMVVLDYEANLVLVVVMVVLGLAEVLNLVVVMGMVSELGSLECLECLMSI